MGGQAGARKLACELGLAPLAFRVEASEAKPLDFQLGTVLARSGVERGPWCGPRICPESLCVPSPGLE